jgi:hypothetical protein
VVVIFFIEFSLAKDKSNILSTSVRFFPFNKTTRSRFYFAPTPLEMKGEKLATPTKDNSENQKGANNAKFSFAGRVRAEIYSRGIFHRQRGKERRPGWSSALIVH